MNSLLKNYGHSARQQTIKNVTGVAVDTGCISRTALLFLLTVAGILGASCKQDINGQHDPGGQAQVARADTLNKPEVTIKVNRKYDDKGNIIGFDSVYSSYYSNIEGDTARMNSLMGDFDNYFNHQHSLLFNRQFNSLFFNDSLRYPDFFHDDFFMKRYELNDPYLRSMMNRMDSIKNRFYSDAQKPTPKQK